ncbi:bi-domain-containing oxidoreductase [Rhodothalassium salexigens]
MKQVLQSLKDGSTLVETVPAPRPGRGQVVVRTHKTLISAGTERMLVDFGKANLLDKARQQPEKVAEVIAKIRTDGLATTLEAVQSKLGQPIPMGYSNVGTVTAVGAGVTGLAVGDRVVSNGHHAEMVRVPPNLCAKVPAGVGDDTAVFTVVGAIALQGIRLAGPSLGETVAVTGLGLIGLMAVQLLRAQGVRVLGIDMDPAKLDLARRFGAETVDLAKAEDPVAKAAALTDGHGVDAVLLTAATKSSTPVAQAARMCRKRGRIVLVGVTGLSLNRADFYEKELTFQVSCSYGPGRYDPAYEQHGQDYPIGFVRWTEQRNFQAVLAMMASGAVRTDALVSHRFPLDRAADAYGALSGGPALGVLLETGVEGLPDTAPAESVSLDQNSPRPAADGRVGVSFIGAGNYAGRVLAPAVAKTVARFEIVASGGGVSGTLMGRARGFRTSTTDTDTVFADPATDLVVVSTPHNSHAALAARALEAGKAAFVEKPLALTLADLDALERAYDTAAQAGRSPFLMVGFNRRFSPHVQALRARLNARAAPPAMVMTVNAGAIPLDHWTQDPAQGGGRLIGEACHFVDLARYLADAPIVRAQIDGLRPTAGAHGHDTATITLGFANGAVATIHYFANGHKGVAKERIEVFQAGAVYALDNFRRTRAVGDKGFKTVRSRGQDKGNAACVAATIDSLTRAAPAPIPAAELFEVSRTVIDLATRFDPRLGGSAGGGDDNGAAAG